MIFSKNFRDFILRGVRSSEVIISINVVANLNFSVFSNWGSLEAEDPPLKKNNLSALFFCIGIKKSE